MTNHFESPASAEEPPELPKGWAWTKFAEICDVVGDDGKKKKVTEYLTDGRYPIIDQGEKFIGGYTNDSACLQKQVPLIIFGDHTRRFKLVQSPFVVGADGVKLISVRKPVCAEYVFFAFQASRFENRGYSRHFQFVRQLMLPIAPLSEQFRIVARIKDLFSEVEEGEAALERARRGLDTWRRALLKAAVTGELTRDWREANRPTETGADLFARIRAELGGLAIKMIPARRPDMHEPRAFFDKPEGWEWARIGDLTEAINYGTSDKCVTDPVGVPVLRMGNIQDGNLDISRLKYADPTQVKNLPLLERGDILFNRTNSAELVGKTAIYRGLPAPCSFASYLIRVRVALCEPDFVVYWLNSVFGKSWVANNKSQQVGQANLSGGKLKRMPVPLPPLLEQKEIVRRLQEQFEVGDTGALTIGQVDRARAALRQSILKAAFEGRLVPQDPADEPAPALLARLRNGYPSNGARRRIARAKADFSHPLLPGLTRQSVDPRVEPAGDD